MGTGQHRFLALPVPDCGGAKQAARSLAQIEHERLDGDPNMREDRTAAAAMWGVEPFK